jgi:O-6-methylguanine DNA methyltransferase
MLEKRDNRGFADRVREVVKGIPRGSVMTYGQVAALAGNPRAARAVGRILSGNYDQTVPCHRVIGADGSIGGYNRGRAEKRRRLTAEGFLPLK